MTEYTHMSLAVGQLVARLSPRTPGLSPQSQRVEFVVNKVELTEIPLRALSVSRF